MDSTCRAGVESATASLVELNSQQAGAGEKINCIVVPSFPGCAGQVGAKDFMVASNQLISQTCLRPVPDQQQSAVLCEASVPGGVSKDRVSEALRVYAEDSLMLTKTSDRCNNQRASPRLSK